MKLNRKGITTVEVIVCFILVTVISLSMYSTISAFNNKRIEESYKSKVLVYKSVVTKQIQDDFIKKGLVSAKLSETVENTKKTYTVDCVLKDGTKRKLIVIQQSSRCPNNAAVSDYYMIKYGPPNSMEEYELPNIGTTKNKCEGPDFVADPSGTEEKKDLRISNVIMNISNENTASDITSHVLSIYIGFYHPTLGNKYAINIVSPINYQ